jgi:hypothetical protein
LVEIRKKKDDIVPSSMADGGPTGNHGTRVVGGGDEADLRERWAGNAIESSGRAF